jgi:hypothetical protein
VCLFFFLDIQPIKASDLDEQFRRDLELSFTYQPSDNFEITSYSVSFPHRFKKTDTYDITGNLKTEYFHTNNASNFPRDLYWIGYYLRFFSERQHIWLNTKSYSDKPFNSFDEIDIELIGAHRILQSEMSSLFIGLSYSTKQSFLKHIPLPILLYEYDKKPLYILGGIPLLNAHWHITDELSLNLSYIPVITIVTGSVSLKYRLNESFEMSLLADAEQSKFLIADRQNKDEKLFIEKIKAGLRISNWTSPSLKLSCFLGYAFKGRFYKGEKFNDKIDKVNIDDALITSIKIRYFFE